jgi:uncharacterized protein
MSTWTRRRFLGATAGLAALPVADAAAAQTAKIPRRPLGQLGWQVSVLGLGGGSQFLAAAKTDDDAIALLNTAIDGGINYLDSAWGYGSGKSLAYYGLVVPKRRKEVFVTSKTQKRKRDEALRELESSLKNLRIDQLDLMQIHLIQPDEDIELLLGKDGVYQALLEMKQQKVVRAIGITGHLAAVNMSKLIPQMDGMDTVLCPVNPYKDSRHYLKTKENDNPNGHFEQLVLPAARKRGLGIIAMKVMAQGELIGEEAGKTTAGNLLRYALSEPGVCTAIVGPGSMEFLKQNLQTAQHYTPLSDEERRKLSLHLSGAEHRFAYQDPGYRDAASG